MLQELGSLEELSGAELDAGDPVPGPIVLVCAHGRRDACCARLGPPLFDALAPLLAHGATVAVLSPRRPPVRPQRARAPTRGPARADPARAGGRGGRAAGGRPDPARPLPRPDALRPARAGGRDRRARGDRLRRDCRPAARIARGRPGRRSRPRTASSRRTSSKRPGPEVPASCGADPEPTVGWVARIESAA